MPDKMSKKIKFALFFEGPKGEVEVRTLEEFEEFFSMAEVIEYFLDGKLLKWLRSHNYSEAKCAVIELLYKRYKDLSKRNSGAEKNFGIDPGEIIKQLIKVFDEIPDEKKIYAIENTEQIEKRLAKVKYIQDNVEFENDDEEDEVLKDVGSIARNQNELDEIIKKLNVRKSDGVGEKTKKQKKVSNIIYMVKKAFPYTLRREDVFGNKTFRSENQNKSKFNNLIIHTRKNEGISDEDHLSQYLDAGFPIIYIDTFEEEKADELIGRVAVGRDIYEWSEAERLFQRDSKGNIFSHLDRHFSLQEVLQYFIDDYRRRRSDNDAEIKCDLRSSILVLKDTKDHLNNFEVTSQLKYLAQLIYNGQIEDCNIIIISSVWNIPSTLEHYLTMMKIKLTKDDISKLIVRFCKNHDVAVPSDMPELLRKGRFDEIFYVGIPNADERRKILNIYIGKIESNENFYYDRTDENFEELVQNTLGCSGADIAGIISESIERSFIESITKKKNANDGTKLVFKAEIVRNVISDVHKMSGWQQLQRILQTYRQSKYKNASEHDMEDFFYWLKLRIINLKSMPVKFLLLLKAIVFGFFKGTNSFAKNEMTDLRNKVDNWNEEEKQIEEKILDKKISWHFRFCRGVLKTIYFRLKGANNFAEIISGKKRVDLIKKTNKKNLKQKDKV